MKSATQSQDSFDNQSIEHNLFTLLFCADATSSNLSSSYVPISALHVKVFCVGATIWNFSIFCISMVVSGFCCPRIFIDVVSCGEKSRMYKPFAVVLRCLPLAPCLFIYLVAIVLSFFWSDCFDLVWHLKHRCDRTSPFAKHFAWFTMSERESIYISIFEDISISTYTAYRGRCTGARSPGREHLSTSVHTYSSYTRLWRKDTQEREREREHKYVNSMSTVCHLVFRYPAILKREVIMAAPGEKIGNILQHVSLGSDHYALLLGQI